MYKRVLSVFFAFVVSLSFYFSIPLQAQASNVSYSKCSVNFRNMYQWMAYTDVDVPGSLTATGFIQGDCTGFKIRSKQKVSWEENSVITASIKITSKRYKNMKAVLRFVNDNDNSFQYNATFKDGTCSYTGTVSNKITDYYVEWELTNFEYNTADEEELTTSISFEQFRMKVESEQTGFFSNVANWFKELFEKLQNGLASIGQWFKDLGNTIVEWFKQLIENIKEAFADLIDNVKQFFSDLTKNLKEWFSNIGQWFVDIGDRIGDFFTKLWNKIWWGNENGESEYEKPVINNKLNDILLKLQEYQANLKSAIDSIGNAADEVSGYISTGTELVNGIVGVAGVGFTALITFGIIFVLVRKVVGR